VPESLIVIVEPIKDDEVWELLQTAEEGTSSQEKEPIYRMVVGSA
jgi:hypothetical protein